MNEKALRRDPSYEETAKMLKVHLHNKHGLRRRSPVPPEKMTPSKVREQASEILEAFLKKEIEKNRRKQSDTTGKPVISSVYQRVQEENVTEEETPIEKCSRQSSPELNVEQMNGAQGISDIDVSYSGNSCSTSTHGMSQTFGKTSLHSLLDVGEDIPFADYVVSDVRSKSLPPEHSDSLKVQDTLKGSKSLSPSNLASLKNDDVLVKKASDRANRTDSKSSSLVTAEGKMDNLTPDRGRRRFKSGSESSCDSENEQILVSEKRKKKSVFTRARERLSSVLSRSRERKSKSEENFKPEKRKPRKRSKSRNTDNAGDVVQERHTHKHGHVEQHHFQTGDKRGLCLEQEVWESTDITDRERGKHKHIDKHSKLKESKDTSPSESSLISNIRRLTSRRSKKKSVPESKSAEFHNSRKKNKVGYDRTISVQDASHKGRFKVHDYTETSVADGSHKGRFKVHDYKETLKEGEDGRRTTTHTQHITTLQDTDSENRDRNGHDFSQRTQPSHPSRTKLGLLDKLSKNKRRNGQSGGGSSQFDGREINGNEDSAYLHRDKSFIVDYDVEESEYRRRLPTGELDIETKQRVHQRALSKDIEVDGLDTPEDDSKKEKEKLYEEIAERLAEIGDNYASESEGATAASPRTQQRQAQGQDERDGDGLTSLERELRDTFRNLGDAFSTENPVSSEATEAARDIVRQATYETFTDSVKRAIGDEVGWNQLAMLFHVTKRAVRVAGFGGAVARQVKEMSLRYIEDKFASWIVDQGGWDSVLEDESTDSELD